jgi:hypothetical protein
MILMKVSKSLIRREIDKETLTKISKLKYPFNLLVEMCLFEHEEVIPMSDIEWVIDNTNWFSTAHIDILMNGLSVNKSKLTELQKGVLDSRYISNMTYDEISKRYNHKSMSWGVYTCAVAFRRIFGSTNARTLTHFQMLSLCNSGKKQVKYNLMYDFGRMLYYSDIERHFSDRIKVNDPRWFTEDTLLQDIAYNGIVCVLAKIIAENKELIEENKRFRNTVHILDMPDIPTESLSLSPRAFCSLARAGIKSSKEIVSAFMDGRIYSIRNIGAKTILEIKKSVEEKCKINLEDIRYEIDGNS